MRKFVKTFAAVLVLTPLGALAADVVEEESARQAVLRLAFPNARISPLPGQQKQAFSVTDPMGRPVARYTSSLTWQYEVIGPVAKEEEEPATDITRVPERSLSDRRQVSMQLYRWKAAGGETLLVAILDYTFPNAMPARCCRAIGRILILPIAADRIFDVFTKAPYAFTAFTFVRFLDTDGSGVEKLMVGADTSGVASMAVGAAVFDLASHKLTPILAVKTVVMYEGDWNDLDIHELTLDELRTTSTKGHTFVFLKTIFAEKATILLKPRTSRVSYPIGYGIPLDW